MSDELSREDVAQVAKLARLEITDEEAALYSTQLSAVLKHAKDMVNLDIEGVPPTSHAIPMENVFREDVVRESLDRQEVLDAAPHAVDNRFAVPKILSEE